MKREKRKIQPLKIAALAAAVAGLTVAVGILDRLLLRKRRRGRE